MSLSYIIYFFLVQIHFKASTHYTTRGHTITRLELWGICCITKHASFPVARLTCGFSREDWLRINALAGSKVRVCQSRGWAICSCSVRCLLTPLPVRHRVVRLPLNIHASSSEVYLQTVVTVRAPVFGRHQYFSTSEHYGKTHGSLLSGWMNYNYTACRWFPTSSNILILPSPFWQIRFESYWLHCSKCRILVLLRYLPI